jgi:peptide-methionine (S)-S-oxide reductase
VVRTRVGYSGGSAQNPTYRSIGDHSETVQIDYDPSVVSYRDLLDIFWESHDPTARSWSRQYRVAIFYHKDEQREIALESRDREAAKRKETIRTEVLPFTGFTLAEDYHQKYHLLQYPEFTGELRALYPETKDFVNSTAAARLNGFLGGYGSPELLKKEIDSYGLSAGAKKRLIDLLSSTRSTFKSCPL